MFSEYKAHVDMSFKLGRKYQRGIMGSENTCGTAAGPP